MSLSNYMENYILDYICSTTTYLGLSTADPEEDGSGLAEPSGDDGYARLTIPITSWEDAAAGSISNSEELTFAIATGDWGTITHWALFDAITDGNMLISDAVTTEKGVDSQLVKFLANTLVINAD